MSKAKDVWRSYMLVKCQRKVRYDHEGQARRKAHQLGHKAYKCRYCSGYHTTSKD